MSRTIRRSAFWVVVVSVMSSAEPFPEPVAVDPIQPTRALVCTDRYGHSAVWDAKHETMLVFGGERREHNGSTFCNDLWAYSPAKDGWAELAPSEPTRPSERRLHACTWDPTRTRMWVFGGCRDEFQGLADLWSFDPETLTWARLEPPAPRPAGRLSAALHYSPGTDELILFGGLNGFGEGSTSVRDLWTYDIKANKWTEKTCRAPQLRQCASALDPKRGLLILHGGFDETLRVRSETWIYEVARDQWRPPVAGTRFTVAHTGVWDADSDRMLVYGGTGYEKGDGKVWSFDPDAEVWTALEAGADKPDDRAYHTAVWVPKERSMLVYGGTGTWFCDPPRENRPRIVQLPSR